VLRGILKWRVSNAKIVEICGINCTCSECYQPSDVCLLKENSSEVAAWKLKFKILIRKSSLALVDFVKIK